jgi:hypothetical protein
MVKDAILSCGIIAAILVIQVGRYNSCWCRMSFTFQINLTPYMSWQWKEARILWSSLPAFGLFVNFLLILWVELRIVYRRGVFYWFGRDHGSPLCKSNKEIQKELDELEFRAPRFSPRGGGCIELRSLSATGSEPSLLIANDPQLSSQNLANFLCVLPVSDLMTIPST